MTSKPTTSPAAAVLSTAAIAAALAGPFSLSASAQSWPKETLHNADTFDAWPFPGDANRDGYIDQDDLDKVAADLGLTGARTLPRTGPGHVYGLPTARLWSDFNADGVVDQADLSVVEQAISSGMVMTLGDETTGETHGSAAGGPFVCSIGADGLIDLSGTCYGLGVVWPDGPVDLAQVTPSWDGELPVSSNIHAVLLTHLGHYDLENGDRTASNSGALVGKYLSVRHTQAGFCPAPPPEMNEPSNDFRFDPRVSEQDPATRRRGRFHHAALANYFFITDARRRVVNNALLDAASLPPGLDTNIRHRQGRPDHRVLGVPCSTSPLEVWVTESGYPFGAILEPCSNAFYAYVQSDVVCQGSDENVGFPFGSSLDPEVMVGEALSMSQWWIATVSDAFRSEWIYLDPLTQGITGFLTDLEPLQASYFGYGEDDFAFQQSFGMIRTRFRHEGVWVGWCRTDRCPGGAYMRSELMWSPSDGNTHDGVFPADDVAWCDFPTIPELVPANHGINANYFTGWWIDFAEEIGIGREKAAVWYWKTISMIAAQQTGLYTYADHVLDAAALLWPDPATPGESIYSEDIRGVLRSRGIPDDGGNSIYPFLPPFDVPAGVTRRGYMDVSSSHPASQASPGFREPDEVVYNWFTDGWAWPDSDASYLALTINKHAELGACDRLPFFEVPDPEWDPAVEPVRESDWWVDLPRRAAGNITLLLPGTEFGWQHQRGLCPLFEACDALHQEDFRAFGFRVIGYMENGFAYTAQRVDSNDTSITYRLSIVDPSLTMPAPLGPATYQWTFTEVDGTTVFAGGRDVLYSARRDQPVTISIERTRDGDGSQDLFEVREPGNALDRMGIAPGSAGASLAPGTALVYDAVTAAQQPCPVIMTQPADLSTAVGEPVELTVEADPAGGPFAFRWLKDGEPIPTRGLAAGRFGDADLPVLRITSASVLDAGVYTCEVTNGCGTTASLGATLTVTANEPGCNLADLAEPYGILDLGDVNAFASAFIAGDPLADVSGDGLLDLTDIGLFVNAFVAGCP